MQGSITLKASSTLALTSAAPTANQTVCNNTDITSITYTIGGSGTGAQIPAATMVVDGLPNGVTGTYSSTIKKYIIEGKPNVTVPYTTVFNYTVTTTGPSGCDEVSLSGTITVEPEEDIVLVSAGSLTNQTDICPGSAITDIIYDIKGSALTISPTLAASIGLPSGINVSDSKIKQSNTVTITGAATGTYIIGVNGSVVSYTYATVSYTHLRAHET